MRFVLLFIVLSFLFACSSKDQKDDVLQQQYLQKGAEIAQLTQAELLKNVSQAMHKGGPGYAIEFCNLQALAIKDSLSRAHDCRIQRLAVKYRNPVDMPQSETEKKQLNYYQQAFEKGQPLQPEVYQFDDHIEYYQPIMLSKEACLKCHGTPGRDIAAVTLQKIKERYPDDRATGFALNDLRGAWKITFRNF